MYKSNIQFNRFKREFEQWIIYLYSDLNTITIKIKNFKSNEIYKSTFNLEYLQKLNLLISKENIKEIFDFISNLINEGNIKIKENDNIKFLLSDKSNIELEIKKEENLSQKINKIINETEILKEENKSLQKKFETFILTNEEKIKELKEENINLKETIKQIIKENEELKKKMEILENENILEKKELDFQKEEIYNLKLLNENKLNEINNRLINFNIKQKLQVTNLNLKKINSINSHNERIRNVTTFPSGKIISVSVDKSIKIYDNNLNIIQDITNAHDEDIIDIYVKDENNFVTCSKDKNIKTWIKKLNKGVFKDEIIFILSNIIYEAHNDSITKIIYCLNGQIISCSLDKKIKIWEEKNSEYKCIKILNHLKCISSMLIIEEKNILISSGVDGTNIWNLNNYDNIYFFKDISCYGRNALQKIDYDRIIVGGNLDGIVKIFSLSERKVIKEIQNQFLCWGICYIEDKGLLLICGKSLDIKIYRDDIFTCILIFKNAHSNFINGIIQLKDKSILSFSDDKIINIWSI